MRRYREPPDALNVNLTQFTISGIYEIDDFNWEDEANYNFDNGIESLSTDPLLSASLRLQRYVSPISHPQRSVSPSPCHYSYFASYRLCHPAPRPRHGFCSASPHSHQNDRPAFQHHGTPRAPYNLTRLHAEVTSLLQTLPALDGRAANMHEDSLRTWDHAVASLWHDCHQ